ncbi:aromatase/cyclase [Streptomyces corynorhini]|uniref:Cyclase n=1 Tax=Streptomyces corynorhini TaxID=2282652 RepID=A0A370BAX6_9ACTN|nr:aromatase/cyclase [Streptomyces corynorhini]RDG36585.1 cyclase [Streptomyces corynorhini]
MPVPTSHHAVHRIGIEAPAGRVYALIRDAAEWPRRFTPTVHVERAALDARGERLRIWATANGEVKHWTSRRTLDPEGLNIRFRQEVCSPPVAAMSGTWALRERPGASCELTLSHTFAVVDDRPEDVRWTTTATDRNSRTELANIKALAERPASGAQPLFSFEDSELVRAPAEAVYAFLAEARKWPARLPHVSRLDLAEPSDGVQVMTMATRAKDGSEHTTESVRVCFPEERRIVYKQVRTPPLMVLHTGEWSVRDTGNGLLVTSRHTVGINEAAVPAVLGADATVADARARVRAAVGGNSAATLALAKGFAEAPHAA